MIVHKQLIKEALSIFQKAEKRGIILRLFGGIAVRIRCTRYSHLLDKMKRFPRDIDFVGLSEQKNEIEKIFKEMGYVMDLQTKIISEGQRYFFQNTTKKITVDVVIDKIEFCHEIDLRNRLRLDKPTIPISDMFLEKLQNVQMNPKDIIDVLIILLENGLDIKYVSDLLSKDWGFYFTVISNLTKVEKFVVNNKFLSAKEIETVKEKISQFRSILENYPKSIQWKLRSIVGDKMKWYDTVDELITG